MIWIELGQFGRKWTEVCRSERLTIAQCVIFANAIRNTDARWLIYSSMAQMGSLLSLLFI